jgi:pimeloyl-ACP methyl ester carboxylesterase
MEKVTSPDGTEIAYERTGDGPVVIIVGGAFNDRHTGAPLAEALAPHFTVVTYDRRGRGESGDTPPYAVEREVEDLGAVLSAVGGSAAAYGVSSGGTLALEAAAAGHNVTKVAMFEPPYYFDEGPEWPEDFLPRMAEYTAAGRRGDTVECFMTGALSVPPQGVEHMRKTPMWEGMEAISHTLLYDCLVMGDRTWPAERMSSVTVPTLVVNSSASAPWMQHTVKQAAASLPAGEHASVNGAPHDAPPDVIAPALIKFFTE